ncbi:MAG: hypothetical protein ACK56J_10510 [Planctomycetota bacterium]|jgi:hypothetical protein
MNRQELLERLVVIEKQVAAIREMLQRDEPVFPEEAVKKLAARVCLDCGRKISEDKRNIRGLHDYCYKRVTRLIETDELSEAAAISSGLLAPRQVGGRPPSVDSAALKKVTADKFAAEIEAMEARGLGPKRGRGKPPQPPKNGDGSGSKKAR